MGRRNTADDFWEKVKKTPNCWEWTAGKDPDGYGIFSLGDKSFRAPKLSWVLTYGSVPEGLCVLHGCDNPGCVNPEHLFLRTNQDNMTDRNSKGRQTKGEAIHTAVLTEIDVRIIRRLIKEGMSRSNLVRMFDCSKGTIAWIAQGRSWKHLL